MQHALNLQDKVVIITGGGKGVGLGITRSFLAHGAKVLICGRSALDELPSVNGNIAVFIAADVRDIEQLNKVVDYAVAQWGRLDVLVNNAGGAPHTEAATASPRFSEKIIALNLLAPLNFAQAANRVMQTQPEGGVIINIASVSGERASPGTAAYGAAKAGLLSLTKSLAVEWAPKVRVAGVTCGMIRTEQAHLHYGDEAGIAAVSATVPLERLATPEDIGNACVFLASSMAAYISGSSLTVHGGGEKPAFLAAGNAAH
jgi:NAD(P)-dependent dehydrogenase (short-subunit alcohol dehydrogenase family)